MARAAVVTSFSVDSVLVALAGLTSTVTRAAAGTNSRRRFSRFAPTSAVKKLIPVALPPGRERLATRPSLTGSSLTAKTIGIVEVAALAANTASGAMAAIQIIRECSQTVIVTLCPAINDNHVLAFDIAGLLQTEM